MGKTMLDRQHNGNNRASTWYNNSNKLFHVNFNAMKLHAHHIQKFRVIMEFMRLFEKIIFEAKCEKKTLFAASLNLIVLYEKKEAKNRCVIV